MNFEQLFDYLKHQPDFAGNVTSWHTIDPKPARYADFPSELDPRLHTVLLSRGISRLYSHQAVAFESINNHSDTVIVTPTASGKTLSYNLPVFQRLLQMPESRALYLFPTKALSQDQVHETQEMVKALGEDIKSFTFDGDTPVDIRRTIRTAGHIVVTNPDMLHQGILPHHTLWIKLFENLNFIVIDEIHYYRGVFGSHLSNLLRRLNRICQFYGSSPTYICASATIANPKEFAENILKRTVNLIDENGSPAGQKNFILYNPPVINRELGLRRSVINEVRSIVRKILPTGIQIIIFARSRQRVELLVTYLKELAVDLKINPEQIKGYRGGYLPKERREIEKGLKNGSIKVVVSTNALELGIDIGQLDVSIMAGYPGSVSSTWQQSGRAGRRQSASLTILVASSNPLDQYIIQNPEYFFGKNPERAQTDADNLSILLSHLKCAAFELPFDDNEIFTPGITTQLLDFLTEERVLRKTENRFHWMADKYPAEQVSLRNASPENVVIVDTTAGPKIIGEIDKFAAPEMLHDDAIYMHNSIQYFVDKLNWAELKAYVHQVDVDHFTDAITKTDLKVLDVSETEFNNEHGYFKNFGDVAVTRVTTAFKKIKFHSHENIGLGKVFLPEQEIQTNALWWEFPDDLFTDPFYQESVIGEGLSGIAHTLGHLIPLYILCDSSDISVIPMVRAPFSHKPTIYVYDKYQGGIGLSKKLYTLDDSVLQVVYRHIRQCPCSDGCPSCTGPMLENGRFAKLSSLRILEELKFKVSV